MEYILENGKKVNIPDAELEKSMKNLDLSKEDAITLWLEDNDYLLTEEYAKELEKTKGYKIQHGASSEKRKTVKREQKPDEEKEMIIQQLKEFLSNLQMENVNITNKTKIVEFDYNNAHYKIDLIRQRAKKT